MAKKSNKTRPVLGVNEAIVDAVNKAAELMDVHKITSVIAKTRGVETPLSTVRNAVAVLARKHLINRASHGLYGGPVPTAPKATPKPETKDLVKAPTEPTQKAPKMEVKVGQWVRFTRNGQLVVGIAQYVQQSTVVTDLGAVHIRDILEVR